MLFNLERITVTDDGLRCLDCASENAEPWYVPSDTDCTTKGDHSEQ